MYTISKKLTKMGSQVGFTFDKTMKSVSEISEGDQIEIKVAQKLFEELNKQIKELKGE